MLSRSPLLLLSVLLFGCLHAGESSKSAQAQPGASGFVLGADVSAALVMERCKAQYSDSLGKADVVTVLRRAGANCFRLRLFVQPNGEEMVTNDLRYTIALARRVKASGASLMLDIHYSDTWADPAKQFKPAAWEKFPFDKLVLAVREYTAVVLRCFAEQGVMPDYVQVGNEITNGMLWPEGKAEFGTPGDQEGWDRFAQLLRAGVQGVHDGSKGGTCPKIVIHVESTGNIPRSQWFFRNAKARGVDFDIIGLSYYTEWHGTIADLSSTMEALASEFAKPVMVVETAYPWKPDDHWKDRPNMLRPTTPAGQKAFLADVRAAVERVPGGLGAGVIYWHPESIQAWGVHAWLGGSCALFDDKGRLLPAAAALFGPSH